MEIMENPELFNGKKTESNIKSINIEKLPENEPQQINVRMVSDESTIHDTPIDLDQLIIDENGYVQTVKRELRVSVDYKSGNTLVTVVDGEHRNVVRNIPQDEIFAVERLITAPAGMLFRAQA